MSNESILLLYICVLENDLLKKMGTFIPRLNSRVERLNAEEAKKKKAAEEQQKASAAAAATSTKSSNSKKKGKKNRK